MKQVVFVVIGILVLAVGWFLVSPLFIDRQVDEAFDYMGDDGRVDVGAVMAMPDDVRTEMRDEIMDAATKAPETMAEEPMPPSEPVAVATGTFVDADAVHKGSGMATLYALPDGNHLVRFEDFRTTNGPDLVVYLAKHPSPASADDVTDGGFLSLGKLKGNVGNQNYAIPSGTNVDDYNSVVIWCELFDVMFASAKLNLL